eukprot:jgi/Chrzof1/7165/Cz02g13150.t1
MQPTVLSTNRELERREWEAQEHKRMTEEQHQSERRQQYVSAIRDLSMQTDEGRQKAVQLKKQKEAQLAAKRERLKTAFVAKQVSKLASAAAKPRSTKPVHADQQRISE